VLVARGSPGGLNASFLLQPFNGIRRNLGSSLPNTFAGLSAEFLGQLADEILLVGHGVCNLRSRLLTTARTQTKSVNTHQEKNRSKQRTAILQGVPGSGFGVGFKLRDGSKWPRRKQRMSN
jgi:hypothetical protein